MPSSNSGGHDVVVGVLREGPVAGVPEDLDAEESWVKTRSFTYVQGDSATSIAVSRRVATPTAMEIPSMIDPAIGNRILGDRLCGRWYDVVDQLLDADAGVPLEEELDQGKTLRFPERR